MPFWRRNTGDRFDIGYQALFVIPTARTLDLSFLISPNSSSFICSMAQAEKRTRRCARLRSGFGCPKRRTRGADLRSADARNTWSRASISTVVVIDDSVYLLAVLLSSVDSNARNGE